MNAIEAVPTLNRLLTILCRSLPAYLADAQPWSQLARREVRLAIDRLLADQELYARRVAEAILQCGGRPQPGSFPPEFTAKNDLSLDFLLREVIEHQEEDVAAIEECVEELEIDSSLHALSEEILGNAKGHLDSLMELLADQE
jgi:hypothetical protein